jgi:LPS-assembly protein
MRNDMSNRTSHCRHLLFILSTIFLSLNAQVTHADTKSAGTTQTATATTIKKYPPRANKSCPVNNRSTSNYTAPRAFSKANIGNTDISADFTESSSDNRTSLDGDVIIEKEDMRVTANHADYYNKQNVIKFSGNVHIDTLDISLDANDGEINLNENDSNDQTSGTFRGTTFYLPDSNMKGQAGKVISSDQIEGETTKTKNTVLYDADITSCDLADPDWLISADEIRLDHDDESGAADNVVMRFKGIPFLYTPHLRFPTSKKRRTGLLSPTIGSGTTTGAEVATPWYWNIAPNQDAVITPHYMDKRGLQMGTDYRYLTESSRGSFNGTYLPDDKLRKNDRYLIHYKQRSRITPNLVFNTDAVDVSDSDYFNDFSRSLNNSSQTHLNRIATLDYDISNWHMKALVQDIKTIDPTIANSSKPYERLPQLTLNGSRNILGSGFQFSLNSEYVYFDHQDNTKATGGRMTLRPGLSLPLKGAAWFFTPAVKFNYTNYNLGTDGNKTTPGTNIHINDRNLLTSSLNTGLFFERPLSSGYRQTLEPRLFYLHVPYKKQSDIPLFDTNRPDFTTAQLFRDNRFVGGDRVGDTNQLTVALTSRILNPDTGTEFLRASIGQIFYFKDRRVALSGDSVDNRNSSDIVANLNANWKRWKSNINLQWDTQNHSLSQNSINLHYRSNARHLFNIGYRKRGNGENVNLEQVDTSFVYAINKNYTAIARWNYSLKDNKGLDTIAGFTYDSCCWSLQLLGQRRVLNTSSSSNAKSAYDNSILVQFVFKGLGSLSGSGTRTILEQSIYGYTDVFQ